MARLNKMVIGAFILFTWLGTSSFVIPASDMHEDNQALFKIARSKDLNEIWYAPNFNKGVLNLENPVKAFWVKKNSNNRFEPLTWIQSKYAYGIKILHNDISGNSWKFQFVSYAKRTFQLKRTSDNKFKVFTNLKNKEIEVTRIFVQIDGGSFWVPSIPFVKLTGVETQTGKEITETIYP